MRVAVIPARGGSKRIPNKNIRAFHDFPIMAYSVNAAIHSGLFDRVIVSTDDEKIAQVAKDFGAEVPFMRPENLSGDMTPTVPVIQHAIGALKEKDDIDIVACIYATAPFISVAMLHECLALLLENESNSDYALPVTEFEYPIQRGLFINQDNEINMMFPKNDQKRTQDLSKTYHDAGQFYFGKTQAWLAGRPILGGRSLGLPISRLDAQDIDNEADWQLAELIYQSRL
ncbi:pseudaminic acid cytidylyltransferase [Oceaniserpentilla sp. 4NH20-0058]|uniref:pseudaminic acid cytidylyltransferase n=1 Tax=Oceaniserpentilla sp. 4NH20-0058 TaxID=3127660 RepID=UPI0031086928